MLVLDTASYRAFAEAVANLEPCVASGKIEPDQVKTLMAEKLDAWPASIADDLGGGTRHFTLPAAREVLGDRNFSELRGSDGEGAIILA